MTTSSRVGKAVLLAFFGVACGSTVTSTDGELVGFDCSAEEPALCGGPEDCASGQRCYIGPESAEGLCLSHDADATCDGEGDVALTADPPLPMMEHGICVRRASRDYLCCNHPEGWECDATP